MTRALVLELLPRIILMIGLLIACAMVLRLGV